MLYQFIADNREAIVVDARSKVASRKSPKPTELELRDGVPAFLDQLCTALRLAETGAPPDNEQIDLSAGRHGGVLFRMGLTVGQVVHNYGSVCQAITETAVQLNALVGADEFQILNLCLDDAIAGAVEEYSHQHQLQIQDQGLERLGSLAHEMRNLLNTAKLAFENIKSGRVAVSGSTGAVLERSLSGLQTLINQSLAEVRLDVGVQRMEIISVFEFIEEIELGSRLEADSRAVHFATSSVDHVVTIQGDRQSLLSTIANLLQNAFKFTAKRGSVSLTTEVTSDRVLFNIADECGGLPPGDEHELFQAFQQRGADRTGVGLGLSICWKAAQANGGDLRVRDIPGKGCVFTLDMPRAPYSKDV